MGDVFGLNGISCLGQLKHHSVFVVNIEDFILDRGSGKRHFFGKQSLKETIVVTLSIS